MKALVYTGTQMSEIRDVDVPVAGDDQVLVDLAFCGICGSDMHAYLGHDDRRPAPLILGHEAAGLVLAGPMAGKNVTVNPLVSCGTCRYCTQGRENLCQTRQIISMLPREGAFAQQLVMPTANLVEVPDGVAIEHAALAEPIAVCWHAARLGREALRRP